jgi:hypothetical protein
VGEFGVLCSPPEAKKAYFKGRIALLPLDTRLSPSGFTWQTCKPRAFSLSERLEGALGIKGETVLFSVPLMFSGRLGR